MGVGVGFMRVSYSLYSIFYHSGGSSVVAVLSCWGLSSLLIWCRTSGGKRVFIYFVQVGFLYFLVADASRVRALVVYLLQLMRY
ncbi:hypothetical protein F5B18DRAFT_574566 [Nemania serpens]|nr:hypothetical protein F5B18DRAFT_574566 [Nemania serpens]